MLDFLLGFVASALPWFLIPVLAFMVALLFFREGYDAELERRHFGREPFSITSSNGKLTIKAPPYRDHAQRCQDYYRDKNLVKPKLIFFAALFVECLIGLMI